MSKRYPRSIRTTDELWNSIDQLAEIGETTKAQLIEAILQKTTEALKRGYNLDNPHDKKELNRIIKEIV